MAHWLYPANIKYYDVLGAFARAETYWPQNTKVAVGDTVYTYIAAPYKQIGFVSRIEAIDLPLEVIIDELKPFMKGDPDADKSEKPFMHLVKTDTVTLEEGSLLSYSFLKEHGLNGMLLGPRKLENSPELLKYIKGIL